LANDPTVTAVVGGGMTQGNDWFWLVLSESKPVLQSIPLTTVDLLTDIAPAYTAGALGAAIGAGVYIAEDLQPERIALLVIDNDAGRGGVPIFQTVLSAAGVELTEIYVPGEATSPQVEAALAAVDAANADHLAIALFEDGCIAAVDAIRSSGIETPVVAIPTCWSQPVRDHLRNIGAEHDIPNGWTFASSYNPFDTSIDTGVPTFLEIVGPENADRVTSLAATYVSASFLSMARALNAVDGDYSRAAIDAEIRSFTGPHPFQIGGLQCDRFGLFKSICSNEVGIWRFEDGDWVTIRGEDDTIDIAPALDSLDFGG
jgi:ABC-type branched-subunit amino acid transport system substrate-binding protein